MKLWKHQEEGIRRALERNYFGFFFEVGTGKTATVIHTVRSRYNEYGRVLPTIIITPLITLQNWKKQWGIFSKIPDSKIHVLKGTGAAKTKTFLEQTKKDPGQIFILNYDALLNDDLYEAILEFTPSVLIVDESHYIKNPTSKRSKKVMKIAERAYFRYILSGTPILNSQMDAFTQMYVLDLGERFGNKFHFFKLKYFRDANAGMPSHKHFPNWVPITGSGKDIEEKISSCTMHVKKEECLDLPPFIKKELWVDMSPDQKKHYETMKRDFVTYIQDKACVASLAMTKALRLQQITTGYMPLDDGSFMEFKENPRLDALEELVLQMAPQHKIIVWACFRHNHEQIAKMLEKNKIKYVMLTGEQTAKEKFAAVEEFERGESRVVIGNQSVGIGIDLISSDISIYYSRNFKLGDDIQSEARNYRGGSEIHSSVTRIDLVCPGTIDERITQALSAKKEIGAELIKTMAFDI